MFLPLHNTLKLRGTLSCYVLYTQARSLKADHKKGPSPLAGEQQKKQKARYRGCLRWP